LGIQHGLYTSHYINGITKERGRYHYGRAVGNWLHGTKKERWD